MDRPRAKRLLIGFAIGIAAYVVQLATAGPGHAFRGMVIDPVFELRGGRSLPVPPSWGHFDGFLQKAGALAGITWPFPALAQPHQLFLWFFLLLGAIAFVLWQGWQATRRNPASVRARTLFIVGLFGLGILPQAMQRVDSGHFAWVSCVVFAFVPIALYEFARRRVPTRAHPAPRDGLRRGDPRGARARHPRVHGRHLLRLLTADVRHPPRVLQDRERGAHLLLRQAGPGSGREHGDRGGGQDLEARVSASSSVPST